MKAEDSNPYRNGYSRSSSDRSDTNIFNRTASWQRREDERGSVILPSRFVAGHCPPPVAEDFVILLLPVLLAPGSTFVRLEDYAK
jgi:hypothetical protein